MLEQKKKNDQSSNYQSNLCFSGWGTSTPYIFVPKALKTNKEPHKQKNK